VPLETTGLLPIARVVQGEGVVGERGAAVGPQRAADGGAVAGQQHAGARGEQGGQYGAAALEELAGADAPLNRRVAVLLPGVLILLFWDRL
jgi:hypothetical protein